MNLHDLTEPVRAILEGGGLTYRLIERDDGPSRWEWLHDGGGICNSTAVRIAESILAEWLGEGCCHQTESGWCWHATHGSVKRIQGRPYIRHDDAFEGPTRLAALIAASAALAKEGG